MGRVQSVVATQHSLSKVCVKQQRKRNYDSIAGRFDIIGYKDEIVRLRTQFDNEEHEVEAIVLYGMLISHTYDNVDVSGGDAAIMFSLLSKTLQLSSERRLGGGLSRVHRIVAV